MTYLRLQFKDILYTILKQRLLFILLCSLFMVSLHVFNAAGEDVPKYKRVGMTYGYLIGQEYKLNLIKEQVPSHALNAHIAELAFNASFGKAKEGITRFLIENLGQKEYLALEKQILSRLETTLYEQPLNVQFASDFIKEVQNRANGNIESPILETLLSFRFLEAPQQELTHGYANTFRTKGHPKSKGTDWQVKIPKSWKAEEASRPNIMQIFKSEYGAGMQSIMLMVKDIPVAKGTEFSQDELNAFFSEKQMKEAVPRDAKFISFTKMNIENNIGGMLQFEQISERLDIKVKTRMVQFMFIRKNQLYSLQCTVSSDDPTTDLSDDMKRFLPLFKLVANSVVVNDQYKR